MINPPARNEAMILPLFCRGNMLLRVVVLAQIVAILLAFAPGYQGDQWVRLGYITLFVQWVVLFSMLLLCTTSRWLNQLTPKKLSFVVLLVVLSITAIMSVFSYHLMANWEWHSGTTIQELFFSNITIALLVGVLGLQFFILHYDRTQRIHAQARAELDALNARIRPHFLFNCLNSAAELTHADPKSAELALLNLAKLLRAAMHTSEESSLVEELSLTESYLALEKLRLGDRLQVVWTISDNLSEIYLPLLTLQPLVENAVRHGVEPLSAGGIISINISVSEEWLTIMIENPPPSDSTDSSGNGIAVDNIAKRLELMYDESARITQSVIDNKYRVKVVVPFKKYKE